MGRAPRKDYRGAWHHVMNRGLAKRVILETRRDTRHFQSLLARVVRLGDLEVHAYTLLTTHFHLLVRSPRACLSAAMQWIENQYVRYFNRSRRRDGPLLRGRFTSRLVETERYWDTLVRYIDQNAELAGVAASSSDYPYCSAYHYSRSSGPPWMNRRVVEEAVCTNRALEVYDPRAYRDVFGHKLGATHTWVMERRLMQPAGGEDPFDDLVGAAPEDVRAWMMRKRYVAEGGTCTQPVLAPEVLASWIQEDPHQLSARCARTLAAGLFRTLCGLTIKEISIRLRTSLATTKRDLTLHADRLGTDAQYLDLAASCVSAVMRIDEKLVPGTVWLTQARTGAWRRPRRG